MGLPRILSEISKFQTWTTQGTVSSTHVPLVFREPGVLTGYRPCGRTWTYYLFSVFKFHNETVNIWTHFIPCFIFGYKAIAAAEVYTNTGDDVFWLMSFFALFGMINSALSSLAHTFHSKSMFVHYLCFQADYAGIALMGFGNSILFLHTASSDGIYSFLSRITLPGLVVLNWITMTGNCIAKLCYKRPYPLQRKLVQLFGGSIQTIVGISPIVAQYVTCFLHPECTVMSLNHHSKWLLTFAISIFFFSSHLPEKKYPGSFDFIGQGHQIFHVFISLTFLLGYEAALVDAQTGNFRPIDKTGTIKAAAIAASGCVLVILGLLRFTRQRVQSDQKTV